MSRKKLPSLAEWKTRSGAFNSVWEALKDIGIATDANPRESLAAPTLQEDAIAPLAHYFSAIFAIRTDAPLFVGSSITEPVADVLRAYIGKKKITVTDNLVCRLSDIMGDSIIIDNRLTHIQNSLRMLNLLLEAVREPMALVACSMLGKLIELLTAAPPNAKERFVSGRVVRSEAGTFVYEATSGAMVQMGVPPESIKPFMQLGIEPPGVYLLSAELFELKTRTNTSDIEFPVYFAFFLRAAFKDPERRARIIGTERQLAAIKAFFSESVFGPSKEQIYTDEDIAEEWRAQGYTVDFERERAELAFKSGNGPTTIDTFAIFQALDVDAKSGEHSASFGDGESRVTIRRDRNRVVRFYEKEALTGVFDANGPVVNNQDQVVRLTDAELADAALPSTMSFVPPAFGVTFLGTSHGFDASGRTTGFIVWINGVGVLVDPPYQTKELLHANGIHPRFVRKVILTHCHSDHDSGLIRRILSGDRVELITTKTINESYKRKMRAVMGVDLGDFYRFQAVQIGRPTRILGATFHFEYAYHTIPCLRFRVVMHHKSLAYSADTFYEPSALAALRAKGVFCELRERMLQSDLFGADLIIHEAGVPPIHTPLTALNDLPPSIKRKLLIVHCHGIPEQLDRVMPDGSTCKVSTDGLRMAKAGVSNTVRFELSDYWKGFSVARQLSHLMTSVFYLRRLTAARSHDLLEIVRRVPVRAGDVVVRAGEQSKTFYIVFAGQVKVTKPKDDAGMEAAVDAAIRRAETTTTEADVNDADVSMEVEVTRLYRGDWFGEQCLAADSNSMRRATVTALCDCVLYSLTRRDFLYFMENSHTPTLESVTGNELSRDVELLSRYRTFLRDALRSSVLFADTVPVEAVASLVGDELQFARGDIIFSQDDDAGDAAEDASMYFVMRGTVALKKKVKENDTMVEFIRINEAGCFGEMTLVTSVGRSATAVAHTDCMLLPLHRRHFQALMERFHTLRMNVTAVVQKRLAETERIDVFVRSNSLDVQNEK